MTELILIAVLGACFGSLASALSHRLPREMPVLNARSECPKCSRKLGAKDLIPIFSWLWFKGKCRQCGTKISVKYLALEAVSALAFLLLYLKFGASLNFGIFALLFVALLILIVSDLETYIIPDSCSVITAGTAITYRYFNNTGWEDAIYGAILGFGIAVALAQTFKFVLKKDALGFGDVKFMAASGLWLGFAAMPAYFILSGIFGIILGVIWKKITKKDSFPFGPALAVSLFFLLLV